MQKTMNMKREKLLEKGQVIQIISDKENDTKTVLNVKVISYDEKTGRIMGYKVNNRTVGDPEGETKEIVITHRDEIRAWLAN